MSATDREVFRPILPGDILYEPRSRAVESVGLILNEERTKMVDRHWAFEVTVGSANPAKVVVPFFDDAFEEAEETGDVFTPLRGLMREDRARELQGYVDAALARPYHHPLNQILESIVKQWVFLGEPHAWLSRASPRWQTVCVHDSYLIPGEHARKSRLIAVNCLASARRAMEQLRASTAGPSYVLYHATYSRCMDSLMRGIVTNNVTNKPDNDFERAFYTTTSLAQAYEYASQDLRDCILGFLITDPEAIREFEAGDARRLRVSELWRTGVTLARYSTVSRFKAWWRRATDHTNADQSLLVADVACIDNEKIQRTPGGWTEESASRCITSRPGYVQTVIRRGTALTHLKNAQYFVMLLKKDPPLAAAKASPASSEFPSLRSVYG